MEIIGVKKIRECLMRETDPEVKLRLIALNLVGAYEMTPVEAAQATMLPVRMISELASAWNEEGYRGVICGRRPDSDPAQRDDEAFVACSYLS